MPEKDEFDRIVENLDLDLSFPDDRGEQRRRDDWDDVLAHEDDDLPEELDDADDVPPDEEERSYRVPPAAGRRPWPRGTRWAVAGLVGPLVAMVVATLAHYVLPRGIVVGLVVIVVAAAIYLVAQLPEHGPGRRDWPDDGAVL